MLCCHRNTFVPKLRVFLLSVPLLPLYSAGWPWPCFPPWVPSYPWPDTSSLEPGPRCCSCTHHPSSTHPSIQGGSWLPSPQGSLALWEQMLECFLFGLRLCCHPSPLSLSSMMKLWVLHWTEQLWELLLSCWKLFINDPWTRTISRWTTEHVECWM